MSKPHACCDWDATEIVRAVASGEISSREVVQAHVERIEAVNPLINAVVVPLFEQALVAAKAADERQARGEELGPLHGLPFTVKECFYVAGTPSSLGLSSRRTELQPEDGVLVRRLREAGGILLGKTNVPQLMLWHECDNPVYGCTNNPWDLKRTPGGSTGGEAAIIAARGSPLGLGNDLGGSIRAPAHFCGIFGLKPTSRRLPRGGTAGTFQGMEAMLSSPGPMARSARDLSLAMMVLSSGANGAASDLPLAPIRNLEKVDLSKLRIGWWVDDGVFPASLAVQRAVKEAAASLSERGLTVVPFQPRGLEEFFRTYLRLMSADAGDHARRLAGDSLLDWRLRKILRLARLPTYLRAPLVFGLQRAGQQHFARLIEHARPATASEYWRLIHQLRQLQAAFWQQVQDASIDVFLSPPHALPAMPHRKPIDLVAAASYAFLMNCLDVPAAVVPITLVRKEEQGLRPVASDQVLRQACATDQDSAGLPVGVQVSAAAWREDIVLSVMLALEEQLSERPTYPLKTGLPRNLA